jgi:coenzyme F420-reducing hydrogenase delta subunit
MLFGPCSRRDHRSRLYALWQKRNSDARSVCDYFNGIGASPPAKQQATKQQATMVPEPSKNIPGMSSFDPQIVVLYCQNCVVQDADVAVVAQQARGLAVRPTMIPCSSKVEVSHLLRILEQGADGVELVACPEDKCRFLVGSRTAEKRVRRASGLLEEIRFGGQRLGISRADAPLSAEGLLRRAEARAEAVKPLGPNPMKKGPQP